jgi:DNA polymerase III sliding clamp (beta) subunit (PCNA family)
MPITVNREDFNAACAAIASVAKKDGNSPASSMAFLSGKDDALEVKGTDMNNWLMLDVIGSSGAFANDVQVDAFKLTELVSKMRGDNLKLDGVDGSLTIAGEKGSKRKLAGLVTAYPEIGHFDGDTSTVSIDDMRSAIDFAAPNMAGEDKIAYQAVRLQSGNAVAYNGSGLAAANAGNVPDVTIASSTISLLKFIPSGDVVTVTVGERLISFKWDGGALVSKQQEGDWPFLRSGLDAIIPEHDHALIVSPAELSAAIVAVRAVAADDKSSKSKIVTLMLSGNGCVVSVQSQAGEATEPFDGEWSGDDIRVNMSASRLGSILKGFVPDMPISIGITPLGDGKPVGSAFRQDAKPGCVGMLAQIR